jgi:hypothetical protein
MLVSNRLMSLFHVAPDPPLLEVFVIGAIVLVAITMLHGWGLDRIVRNYRRTVAKLLQQISRPSRASLVFGRAVLLMLVLHILDNWVWALVLNQMGLIPNIRNSFYFVANTYTTLGYGDVPLGPGWREFCPIIAISGLFTFGWSTSVMFSLVSDRHDLVDELASNYARQMKMRKDLLAQLCAQRREESASERLELEAEHDQEQARSMLARLRMCATERKKLREMRQAAQRLAAETIRREREAESRIYKPGPRHSRKNDSQ